MKKLIFCLGIIVALVCGSTVFSFNHNASAQTYRTTPNPYGGGTTTRGPSGTYRTTPNPYGGGTTTRRQ
jgi:hypothetical protein